LLIQQCQTCNIGLDVTNNEPLSIVSCPECGKEMLVSETIDHFRLLTVAGRGGMGVVYKAMDLSLDRVVALKVLRKDRLGNEAIAQLENEASITASINHPHVVKVFTTGTDHGRFYLSMELVNQGTLDDLIRIQGRVAEAQVLDIAIQVADGLRAAYHAGLIHRDVKPGNILFADSHTAKIVDFGLAMAEQAAAEAVGSEIWGTPYYVAPEKLDEHPEDFRSDIYSLGATLFHALAGRPPFEAHDASMVALKHLKSQAVSLQAFAPWVSGSTAYVINRTLLKDPDQRYQSYDELIEHLEYAKSQLLADGKKSKPKQRVVLEDAEQQRLTAGLTIGMLAVAVIAGGVFLYSVLKPKTHEKPTAAPIVDVTADSVIPQTPEFKKAVSLIAQSDYENAAQAFHRIQQNAACPQPLLQWSLLHEGLAELLSNHEQASRATFHKLADHPYSGTTPEAEKLSGFFAKVGAAGQGDTAVPAADTKLDSTTYETLGLIAFGLKDWQLGFVDEAAPVLRQVRQAKDPKDCPWIGDLQAATNPLLDSYMQYKIVVGRYQNAEDIDAKSAAANDLRNVDKAFARAAGEVLKSLDHDIAAMEAKARNQIAPGLYQIINHKSKKALEVANADKNDKVNIQQAQPDNSKANQKWMLYSVNPGLYRISPLHSGKSFDLFETSDADGAQIGQWGWVFGPNQQWRIEKTEDGTYKIISCQKKVCAIRDGSTDNGAGLIQISDSGDASQRWDLVRIDLPTEIPQGIYRIFNAKTFKSLDVSQSSMDQGAQVWQWTYNDSDNQIWEIKRQQNGSYQIIATHSHRALDLNNREDRDGAKIQQWEVNSTPAQAWKIELDPGKGYKLHTEVSDRLLSIDGGSNDRGALITIRASDDKLDQRWWIVPVTK